MRKKRKDLSSKDIQNNHGLREPKIDENFQKQKRSKKQRIIEVVLIVLAALFFVIGTFLIVQYYYNEAQRQKKVDDFLTDIYQGDYIIRVNPSDFVVEGEDYEDFSVFEEGRDIDEELFKSGEEVELIAAGVIEIESIDLELPLWTTADLVALRYGAGIFDGSPDLGQEGNLVVLGHRMRAKGRIFNRLDEVMIDDEIIITRTDGTYYVYKVTEIIPKLDPADLPKLIKQENAQGKQITLVTCTPVGNSTHRLIVIGHIVE